MQYGETRLCLITDKKEAMIKELKQIQRKIEEEQHCLVPSGSESEDEHWFLGFNEKGRDVYRKDVRMVLEDIGNQHENVELGFRIKEGLLEERKKS